MVYRSAVGLFVGMCFSAVWIFQMAVTQAQTGCSTIVREGNPYTIEKCQPENCSVNASRENVIWCLDYCTARANPDCGSLCRNSTGYTNTVREVPPALNRIQLTDSGGLYIPEVTFELRDSTYNCSVVDEEGNICGTQTIDLTYCTSTTPGIRIESTLPSTRAGITATVGETMALCVQGESPLDRSTHWAKGALQIHTVDISHITDCLQCTCLGDLLDAGFNLSLGSSQNETRYSAYIVGAVDNCNCVENLGFMSFLVIDGVTFGDKGTYAFNIASEIYDKREDFTIAELEYFFLEPNFHNPEPDEIVLAESDNEFLCCNATTSGNADLQWMWNGNGAAIPIQVISGTNHSNISDSVLTEMCRELSPTAEGGVFSISLGRTEVRRYTSNSVATVLLQQLGLFLCRVQANNSGSYFCAASNSARESPRVRIIVRQSTPSVEPGQQDIYIIVGVVSVTAVAVLAIVILACGYLRYRSLKSEALPMSPMETFPLHSYANPALLQLVASRQDPLEFPRERLTFTRVLGEGQFGQVWEAIATGICPDHSRNVVAVKTLKLNSRPSDRDDLESEVEIMRNMEPHPNIINFLGQCSETVTDPLCILMEFAVFGSLKSYLSECKKAMSTPPAPMPYAYPLCPYHHHKMLQNEGEYSDTPAGGNAAPTYAVDPAIVAHMQRLLRLLQSDNCPYQSDYYPYQEDKGGAGGTVSHYDRLAVSNYDRLAVSNYDRLAVSNYDRLAPLPNGSQCAYHPSLEETYQHPLALGFASGRSEYYNQADMQESASSRQQSDNGVPPTLGSFPGHSLGPGSEATPTPAQFSSSYTNVRDHPTSSAAADQPLPDEYDYASPATCPYCNQLASLVEYSNVGGGTIAPPLDGAAPRQSMFSLANLYEGGLTHFDVLDFAVQIARGMEHLEKMKCVHRDLAARNVLIAEGFLLKIGDFGLARDLTERDYYRKITAGRLPVRWMAIESLQDRTHTHKSDVWSYGVVLWEILTYGDLPYGKTPIASSLEALTHHLRTGNRLQQPTGCSDEMYGLMRSCWDADPTKRPSFSELVSTFDNLLSVAHGYLTMSAEATIQHRRSSMMEANLPASVSNMAGGGGGGTNLLSPLTAALHSVSTTCLTRSPSDRNLARCSIGGMARSPSASCIPSMEGTTNLLLPSNTAPPVSRDPSMHAASNRISESVGTPAAGGDSSNADTAPHAECVPIQLPLLGELPKLMVTPAAIVTPPATTVTPATMVTPPATTVTPATMVTPPATMVTSVATTVTSATMVTPPATMATSLATTVTPVTMDTPLVTMATPAVIEDYRIASPQLSQSKLFQVPDLIPNGHLSHKAGEEDSLPKDGSIPRQHSRSMQKREGCQETEL